MFERKLIKLCRKGKTSLLNYFFWTFKKFFQVFGLRLPCRCCAFILSGSLHAPELLLMFDVFKCLVLWESPFICKCWTFPAMHLWPSQWTSNCAPVCLSFSEQLCPWVFSCFCLWPCLIHLYTSVHFHSSFPSSNLSLSFWTMFLPVGCLRNCHLTFVYKLSWAKSLTSYSFDDLTSINWQIVQTTALLPNYDSLFFWVDIYLSSFFKCIYLFYSFSE